MRRCLFLLLIGLAFSAQGQAPNLPFAREEKLTYDIVWNHLMVGSVTVGVSKRQDWKDKQVYHFYMISRTNSTVDNLYRVRHLIHSYTATDLSRSFQYRSNQDEGGETKIILLDYDWEKKQVHYTKNNNEDRGWRNLSEPSVDPLALFFAMRAKQIDDKTTELRQWAADAKTSVEGRIEVPRRETIKIGETSYKTIVLQPDLKDLGGVFKKSNDAKLVIWVTDDEKRIPVQVESEVIVGKFYIQLKEYIPGKP